jgi:hypothetical protein
MAVTPVQVLMPSSGAVPSNGHDPISRAGFTEWEVGDEAGFSVVVPETYVAGNNFFLRVEESSATASARHRWEISAALFRPGLDHSDEEPASETTVVEYLSSASAGELTTRTFCVTGAEQAGRVSGMLIQSGDILSFVLRRTDATDSEDFAPIRVFDLSLVVRIDDTAVSDCAGRVGKIVDSVRDLFNETGGGFLSDQFVLRAINRCEEDLAKENYWRTESWIPAASGSSSLDLLDAIPAFQDIHQVRYSGQTYPMTPLDSFREYEALLAESQAGGIPEYYLVQNNRMYVWPAASQDAGSGFCIYHSYRPEDLTCSSENPDPAIPRSHDTVFVYYVLKQAFLRDRHAPGADVKFTEYARLYDLEKVSLLGEGEPPHLAVRPGR